MALRLTLKPNERFIVNGCVITNSNRRQTLTIENRADVIRGEDILDETSAATPVKEVYFMIQSAMLEPKIRDKLTPIIQKNLGKLTPIFHADVSVHLIEAANHVATRNYYNALRALKPVIAYESELLALFSEHPNVQTAAE